jgi:hypothetical protein
MHQVDFVVWLPSYPVFHSSLQGDSGEKVNVFGGGSIDNCEKKNRMDTRLIMNGFWYRAVRIYKYKNVMNGNKDKVKQPHYRPKQALRVPGGWGSQISRKVAY